jgi:hypothetical protein
MGRRLFLWVGNGYEFAAARLSDYPLVRFVGNTESGDSPSVVPSTALLGRASFGMRIVLAAHEFYASFISESFGMLTEGSFEVCKDWLQLRASG